MLLEDEATGNCAFAGAPNKLGALEDADMLKMLFCVG